jgi:hypothetical protein
MTLAQATLFTRGLSCAEEIEPGRLVLDVINKARMVGGIGIEPVPH